MWWWIKLYILLYIGPLPIKGLKLIKRQSWRHSNNDISLNDAPANEEGEGRGGRVEEDRGEEEEKGKIGRGGKENGGKSRV